jgi:hypothetical protein
VSVPPGALAATGRSLAGVRGCRWLAEWSVGTVHVAGDDPAVLGAARTVAHERAGWMLREAGGGDLDGFGVELPNAPTMRRIKAAFDPAHKCNPGRLPL